MSYKEKIITEGRLLVKRKHYITPTRGWPNKVFWNSMYIGDLYMFENKNIFRTEEKGLSYEQWMCLRKWLDKHSPCKSGGTDVDSS